MNAISAIAQAFLNGDVLTIKTAFKDFGTSNLPREVGRAIERKFKVRISKVPKKGKSRWGVPVRWHTYRLNKDDPENAAGIEEMIKYVESNGGFVKPERRPVGRPKIKEVIVDNNKPHIQERLF